MSNQGGRDPRDTSGAPGYAPPHQPGHQPGQPLGHPGHAPGVAPAPDAYGQPPQQPGAPPWQSARPIDPTHAGQPMPQGYPPPANAWYPPGSPGVHPNPYGAPPPYGAMQPMYPPTYPGYPQPINVVVQNQVQAYGAVRMGNPKKRETAILLAVLGHFFCPGLQRFYLGETGMGILYFLTIGLCGVGQLIDLIRLAMMSQQEFDAKYNYLLPR